MKEYTDFKDLFNDICEIKAYVIKLWGKELHEYRNQFYSQPFKQWRLDLMWSYCWGDMSYEEIEKIFKNSRLI